MDEITVALAGRMDRRLPAAAGRESPDSAERFDRAVAEASRDREPTRADERRRPAESVRREPGPDRPAARAEPARTEPAGGAAAEAPPAEDRASDLSPREEATASPPSEAPRTQGAQPEPQAQAAQVPTQPVPTPPPAAAPGFPAAGDAALAGDRAAPVPDPAPAPVADARPAVPAVGAGTAPQMASAPSRPAAPEMRGDARSASPATAAAGRRGKAEPGGGGIGAAPAAGNAAGQTAGGAAGQGQVPGDPASARAGGALPQGAPQPGPAAGGTMPFAQIMTEYASQRLAGDPAPAGQATPSGPAAQVAERLVRVVKSGHNAFVIDLSPAELGRVRVEAEVDNDRVRLVVHAERAETVDLLRADLRVLERALGDAGLKLDQANLQFAGRGDDQPQRFADAGGTAGDTAGEGRRGRDGGEGEAGSREAEAPAERLVALGEGLIDVVV